MKIGLGHAADFMVSKETYQSKVTAILQKNGFGDYGQLPLFLQKFCRQPNAKGQKRDMLRSLLPRKVDCGSLSIIEGNNGEKETINFLH